jgi:RHS repeat-associated protein
LRSVNYEVPASLERRRFGDLKLDGDETPPSKFGEPESGSAGRFGWLGGKSRRTELSSGVIQMGARSYVPQMGRFLTTDPVPGGSANPYDYANADPVNGLDLEGTAACHAVRGKVKSQFRHHGNTGVLTYTATGGAQCSRSAKNVVVKVQVVSTHVRMGPIVLPNIAPHPSGPTRFCGKTPVSAPCMGETSGSVSADVPCDSQVAGSVSVKVRISWYPGGSGAQQFATEVFTYPWQMTHECQSSGA